MYVNALKLNKINGNNKSNINRLKKVFLINLNEKELEKKFRRFKLKHKNTS